METKKLQDLIIANKKYEAEKEEREFVELNERISIYSAELNNWNAAIKEWIDNINTLINAKYLFFSGMYWWPSHACSIKQKVFTIGSDSIYHDFGMLDGVISRGQDAPSRCTILGVHGGGAWGDWNICTDGNKWWIQHITNGEVRSLREQDYKLLLCKMSVGDHANALERFSTKMAAIYEYLEQNRNNN